MVYTQNRGLHTFSHDTALINLFSTTKVYTSACGRTCDMGRPERRERERKTAARTCHSLDAFFSPKKRKTGMYFKFITFQKVTCPTPNHLLWYQHTPDLHPGIAKVGLYEHDLPSPECVHQELSRWKQRYVLRCIYGI